MNDNSQSIIIFGGCFNPPTLAHQEIIKSCLNLPNFKEVWLMPSASGYSKKINTKDTERITMLHLVKHYHFNNNPRLVISDFELNNPHLKETYHTVDALSLKHKTSTFWYAFGADSYTDMPNWGRGKQLQTGLNLIIFKRGKINPPNSNNVIPLYIFKYSGLSSTKARDAVVNNLNLSNHVSPYIGQYIKANNLYI
ncbi:MAG: nicotinate-nucleotide adenylyltransferase [Patescibacteria group bacterium]|nr:nicotinate-nucleotide adenylyltransferase [Patescibacteria group bacterium]